MAIDLSQFIYLIAPPAGWLAAQGIKYILKLRKDGLQWGDFIQSGGMPSSHTAFITSLTTVVGLVGGWQSGVFAICVALTAIVGYDATGVRRTTGEQTLAIRELAKQSGAKLHTVVHQARGHTLPEVIGGAITGVAVGLILYAILYNQ